MFSPAPADKIQIQNKIPIGVPGISAGLRLATANRFIATGLRGPVSQVLPSTPMAWSALQPQLTRNCSRNEVKDDQKENLLVIQRTAHPPRVLSEARPASWQECRKRDQSNGWWSVEWGQPWDRFQPCNAMKWPDAKWLFNIRRKWWLLNGLKNSSRMMLGSAGWYRKIKGRIHWKVPYSQIIMGVVMARVTMMVIVQ